MIDIENLTHVELVKNELVFEHSEDENLFVKAVYGRFKERMNNRLRCFMSEGDCSQCMSALNLMVPSESKETLRRRFPMYNDIALEVCIRMSNEIIEYKDRIPGLINVKGKQSEKPVVPQELDDRLWSLCMGDDLFILADVFAYFHAHKNILEPDWLGFFFNNCMEPVRTRWEKWKTHLTELREYLELYERLLGGLSGAEALRRRQEINYYYSSLCYFEDNEIEFGFYAKNMLQDSVENIKDYFEKYNDSALRPSLSELYNPFVVFCENQLAIHPSVNSICFEQLPALLEQYQGILHTVSVSGSSAVNSWTLLIEEAIQLSKKAKELVHMSN